MLNIVLYCQNEEYNNIYYKTWIYCYVLVKKVRLDNKLNIDNKNKNVPRYTGFLCHNKQEEKAENSHLHSFDLCQAKNFVSQESWQVQRSFNFINIKFLRNCEIISEQLKNIWSTFYPSSTDINAVMVLSSKA